MFSKLSAPNSIIVITCTSFLNMSLNFEFKISMLLKFCHNPSLGLMTKARACKVAGQEESSGITPHAPGNVGKCEGMNPHTSKRSFHFGSWSLGGLPNIHRVIAGVKTQWIKEFLKSLIALGM
jgi:hypothetical protein